MKTGRTWAPYGFDGRAFAAIICYVRGRWDDALELWDVGPDAPMLAARSWRAVALQVAAGRGEVDGARPPSPIRSAVGEGHRRRPCTARRP